MKLTGGIGGWGGERLGGVHGSLVGYVKCMNASRLISQYSSEPARQLILIGHSITCAHTDDEVP